jgi:hypothetical protein
MLVTKLKSLPLLPSFSHHPHLFSPGRLKWATDFGGENDSLLKALRETRELAGIGQVLNTYV